MKKLIAVLLSLCLIAAMVPMAALADEAAPETEAASSSWYNRDNWSYDEAMNAWYYNGIPYVELTDDAPEWVVERWFGEDDYWHGGWHDGWHDGWWGEHKPVAYVGYQWYWDFSEALEAARTIGTVTLTGTVYEDVTLENVTVTGSYRWGGAFSGDVTTKGNVKLKNLTVYGQIKVDSGNTVADNVSVRTSGYDVIVDGSADFKMYSNCGIDYIWADKHATVETNLHKVKLSDGNFIYTDDVSEYYVAYAGGKYYNSLEDALDANSSGTIKLLKSDTIGSDTIPTGVDLYISSGVTLTVKGTLKINGVVYNYGKVSGDVDTTVGTLFSYVDIDTVPSGAEVTVWHRSDRWHGDWDWRWDKWHNWVEDDGRNGEYWLTDGWYYYEVSEDGYVSDSGWFEVDQSAVSFSVRLEDDTEYRVWVETTSGGSLEADTTYAKEGEWVYITVEPNLGYALEELTVTRPNGSELKLERVRENYYRFEMPGVRVTVDGSFVRTTLPFTDVSLSDWFYEAVNYVYLNELMDGVSTTRFAPDTATNRAMVVEILYRMAGSPSVSGTSAFTDVSAAAWYADAVKWATDNGVVEGRSATVFDPNAAVSRQELAAMLYRYAQYKGYDVSIGENTNILSYTDVAGVAEYAMSAMQWACGSGVVNGTAAGVLSPNGSATRAQLATMLMRFIEYYD